MELRERLNAAMKDAMRAKDAARLSAIRLIAAALKDREIELRAGGAALDEAAMLAVLGKMVKQRQDSARVYREGGRPDLAAKEEAEIAVIAGFLPRAMTAQEVAAAIDAAIAATGAAGIRDMGRVMAFLRERHAGAMDFAAAGAAVKARLG
ncbi:MAG: GatB/YqeY domain-containing protein [Rhodobacteraceae bacterium]|nr:GatB/YqeY domain-containing protein [Paracoccaceae bacterium]